MPAAQQYERHVCTLALMPRMCQRNLSTRLQAPPSSGWACHLSCLKSATPSRNSPLEARWASVMQQQSWLAASGLHFPRDDPFFNRNNTTATPATAFQSKVLHHAICCRSQLQVRIERMEMDLSYYNQGQSSKAGSQIQDPCESMKCNPRSHSA